jgi:ERCC4-type nuclease
MSEILLDPRAGSGDLATYLRHWQVPHTVTRLDFGDAAVEACGPVRPPVVGIEIKKVRDALQCMRDGRFAGHQLPGLLRDYGIVWLVIEGPYDVDYETGTMTVVGGGRGRRKALTLGRESKNGFSYQEFDSWLMTLEVKAGIHVRRTQGRVETARFLWDCARWWEKDWDAHKAHLALHVLKPDTALLVPATTMRKVCAQLPSVGWTRSAEIEKRFGTIEKLLRARVDQLAEIDGVGTKLAKTIYDSLRK